MIHVFYSAFIILEFSETVRLRCFVLSHKFNIRVWAIGHTICMNISCRLRFYGLVVRTLVSEYKKIPTTAVRIRVETPSFVLEDVVTHPTRRSRRKTALKQRSTGCQNVIAGAGHPLYFVTLRCFDHKGTYLAS